MNAMSAKKSSTLVVPCSRPTGFEPAVVASQKAVYCSAVLLREFEAVSPALYSASVLSLIGMPALALLVASVPLL
jgi:hypothetical protein